MHNRIRWIHDRLSLFIPLTLAVIALFTWFGPAEKTLGDQLRLVLLHGAWVQTGKTLFALAGLVGLAALLGSARLHSWSRALGWAGMIFWLTYLPMSLLVMQLNWGGLFFDEPRWQVPFTLAVVGLLLQGGLYVLQQPRLTSLGNLVFGALLWLRLGLTQNILHPDSPVAQSGSASLQIYFASLFLLVVLLALQVTLWLKKKTP